VAVSKANLKQYRYGRLFLTGRVTDCAVIAAVGVLASIPGVLIAVLFQRFIVSGLVGGSVKG
ncbi:MAG: hypothetical protein HRU05_14065, partial [Oceanospirillaceae bacterium]|nr:hypothetical protein [Oceanospirillaceae bacterium]